MEPGQGARSTLLLVVCLQRSIFIQPTTEADPFPVAGLIPHRHRLGGQRHYLDQEADVPAV